ncbi:MAG: apolipoprotein N-acyltransferase [Phycisphaeraceae bacterium]|nr:apolipoprotein N-acyltransferase [Phycisphaeraceae bacterium]
MRRSAQVSTIRLWHLLVAGLAYALLTALAFPPIGFWPLAFVAPAPLIWAATRPGRVSLLGGMFLALGTTPLWAFTHMFLLNVAPAGFPLLCAYLAAYPALFVGLHRLLRRFIGTAPTALTATLVWVGLEWLRGEVMLTGYPWYLAGLPLIELPVLAAPAALFGVYFVSALVVAMCGALADAAGWTGRPRTSGGVQAAAIGVLWLVCVVIARGEGEAKTEPLRIAVIQTNVPQDNKIQWTLNEKIVDFRRFLELTRQAAIRTPPPDLILWPETMFPGAALNPEALEAQREAQTSGIVMPLEQPLLAPDGEVVNSLPLTVFADELLRRQRELGVPMIVGAIAMDGLRYVETERGAIRVDRDRRYNSTFVVSEGRVDPARYDKIDLTPFGEVVPYAWRNPALQQRLLELGARGMSFDLSYGSGPKLLGVPIKRAAGPAVSGSGSGAVGGTLSVGEVFVATPICFEVTKPLTCRALAVGVPGARASFLINPSNDGWFADYHGREIHLQLARWRCVELGLPMVRAVNTGISAVIDGRGRLLVVGPAGAEHPTRTDGVLTATVPIVPAGATTAFARWGHVPMLVMLGAMAVAAGGWRIGERRLKRRGPMI